MMLVWQCSQPNNWWCLYCGNQEETFKCWGGPWECLWRREDFLLTSMSVVSLLAIGQAESYLAQALSELWAQAVCTWMHVFWDDYIQLNTEVMDLAVCWASDRKYYFSMLLPFCASNGAIVLSFFTKQWTYKLLKYLNVIYTPCS